jgi:NitT/TauT family transport system substrate-binding protein
VPAREAVRFPYSAVSISALPHWVTYDAGLYEREGLDVAMEYIATSTVLGPALLNGEIGLAYTGPEFVMASSLQGGDLVIAGAGLEKAAFWLATHLSVRAPGDLRGKRLGITRFGASSDVIARYYLSTVGLQPEQDITILQMGGIPEALAGLEAGALDAAILGAPFVFQARRGGATILADLGDLDFVFYQLALVTSRRYLAERPEVARRVARAFAQGWRLLRDESAALASLRRYSGETDDELLLETYRDVAPRFPDSPVPRPEPIRTGLQQLAAREPAAPQMSPEQFIAPEYVAEALAAVGPR